MLFVVTLSAALLLAVQDRLVANPAEQARLVGVAFKRGLVCSATVPAVSSPLRGLSGPLEIVLDKVVSRAIYPFAQVDDLLAWGIPAVRIGRFDYRMDSGAGGGVVTSAVASGPPAAVLHVEESRRRWIRAKLVQVGSGRTVFDQTWVRHAVPPSKEYYCPEYDGLPRAEEQPRQLLLQALGLPATVPRPGRDERWVPNAVQGRIVGRAATGHTGKMLEDEWRQLNPGSRKSLPQREYWNGHCPSDVGWESDAERSAHDPSPAFRIGDTRYHWPRSQSPRATCGDGVVYFYEVGSFRDQYSLVIEARSLSNFRRQWATIVRFPVAPAKTPYHGLQVRSVQLQAKGLFIELVDDVVGEVMLLRAYHPFRPPG